MDQIGLHLDAAFCVFDAVGWTEDFWCYQAAVFDSDRACYASRCIAHRTRVLAAAVSDYNVVDVRSFGGGVERRMQIGLFSYSVHFDEEKMITFLNTGPRYNAHDSLA